MLDSALDSWLESKNGAVENYDEFIKVDKKKSSFLQPLRLE